MWFRRMLEEGEGVEQHHPVFFYKIRHCSVTWPSMKILAPDPGKGRRDTPPCRRVSLACSEHEVAICPRKQVCAGVGQDCTLRKTFCTTANLEQIDIIACRVQIFFSPYKWDFSSGLEFQGSKSTTAEQQKSGDWWTFCPLFKRDIFCFCHLFGRCMSH